MLREYQQRSVDLIRTEFQTGTKKVLLWLATGGGKTVVFSDIVKSAVAKERKCIILVRGRKLVDQASQRLFRENVSHGVLMAGHYLYKPTMPVQVCSIDTLIARKLRPPADLIIIDEAHLSISDGYREVIADYPNAYIVAVTATPYVDKSLTHVAQKIVHPISMNELIEQGFLVPFRYFAPSSPELSAVKVSSSTKDYVVDDLEKAMNRTQLTGKIIDHWKKLASDLPTVCFAVNINHSKILAEQFRSAGVSAEHCDADSTDGEREEIIRRLTNGETKVVCNVGIFCTGIDIPCLGAIIMARPTKSRNLYIQQAGRGTRTFAGKQNCILLDHAGNILRLGLPTMEYEVDLSGKKQTESVVHENKTCTECFCVFQGMKCPECGTEKVTPPPVAIEESNDELKELFPEDMDPVLKAYNELLLEQKKSKRKNGWACYKLVDRFGFESARAHLPHWFIQRYVSPQKSMFAGSPYAPAKTKPVI